MPKRAFVEFEECAFEPHDREPRSQVRGSLSFTRRRIRERLAELRATPDTADVPFQSAKAFGVLEEIIFDVTNEFAEEEMLLIKHDEQRWYGHHCCHEALLSAMQAVKRAGLRCQGREDLRIAVDAIGEWLLNHFRTVDARDEQLLRS